MYIPGIIVDAIVRLEGTEQIVGLATVTLPDIEHSVEEIKGLGVDTFEQVNPSSTNALTLQLKFNGFNKNMTLGKNDVANLVIKVAVGGMDSDAHGFVQKAMIISCKGRVKKRTGGELGKGTKNEPEIELALTYYKQEIDGEVIVEIDKINTIAIIDGKNAYEETRKILS